MAEALPEKRWLIFFLDADMRPEFFFGEGAEQAARERHKQLLLNWNCYLFCEAADQRSKAPGAEREKEGA